MTAGYNFWQRLTLLCFREIRMESMPRCIPFLGSFNITNYIEAGVKAVRMLDEILERRHA